MHILTIFGYYLVKMSVLFLMFYITFKKDRARVVHLYRSGIVKIATIKLTSSQQIMPMMPYEVEIFLEKSQKLMDLCFLHKKYKETEQRKSVKKKNKEKGNKDKGNKGTRTGVQRKRTKEENGK